jgi:DNA-binding winged helix-turn-helix (wHTH) protein
VIALRPKTFAVLRYLVEHAGQLILKDELLDTVWAGTIVSDTVLKSCIRELRDALDDDAQRPQYIATVHRRGYRFIGEVGSRQHSVVSDEQEKQDTAVGLPTLAPRPSPPAPFLVGREAELMDLHSLLDKALCSERQLVFVTGEPGIGKTTLVDAFLQLLADQSGVP